MPLVEDGQQKLPSAPSQVKPPVCSGNGKVGDVTLPAEACGDGAQLQNVSGEVMRGEQSAPTAFVSRDSKATYIADTGAGHHCTSYDSLRQISAGRSRLSRSRSLAVLRMDRFLSRTSLRCNLRHLAPLTLSR